MHVASPPQRPATPSIEARVASLEASVAALHELLAAHARTAADVLAIAQRHVTRIDAATRGVRLGRPPGSRGSAAHPSELAARDAADVDQDGDAPTLFADLRNADAAILECLLEALTGYLVAANVTAATVSSIELERHARQYQAEMGRGWPFSSSKHFSRRVGMAVDELRANGLRVTKLRSTKGKRYFRLEQLAADGFPVAVEPESQAASGDSDAAPAR